MVSGMPNIFGFGKTLSYETGKESVPQFIGQNARILFTFCELYSKFCDILLIFHRVFFSEFETIADQFTFLGSV